MASKPDLPRQILFAVTAFVSSAALLFFATGLHPIWWLTWIAPLPILLLAPRSSRVVTFLTALAAWSAGGLNMWYYLHGLLTIPIFVCLQVILAPAVIFALIVLLFRALVGRGALWQATLAFPTAWVTYEFVNSLLSPHSTFGNVAYSQMNFLPVLQIASITGIWGIGFCLFLLPAALAVSLSKQATPQASRSIAIISATFLALVLGFDYWRLNTPAPGTSIQVGLVASDLPQNLIAGDHDEAIRLLREYAQQAEALAVRGAKIIIIPEKTAVVLDPYRAEVDTLYQPLADHTGTVIIVGLIDVTPTAKWNEARVYLPQIATPATYNKQHMLPQFESSFTPGTERTEFSKPAVRWGVTICKDMDFPRLSREYGADGTALLLVPAWDFNIDGWLHGRMAILRGVESGFSIARAAKQGILTLTDNRGRVIAQQPTGGAPYVSLLASIPVRHDDTLYARFGDWFAWLCVAALLATLALGFRRTA